MSHCVIIGENLRNITQAIHHGRSWVILNQLQSIDLNQ